MCGITGFWSTEPLHGDAAKVLKDMTETIHHRGPDGYGSHFDGENGLAMAHARLSIIDLEGGRQPLYDMHNKNVLTVNGEFYGYKKIRTDLNLEGFNFTTKSDSEIALYLYRKHGLDFVEHLRGEFAFVLYDAEKDRLIVVRDRYGIRPMFYHFSENTFYYGSEIKALFANRDVPRAFDEKAMIHQMMHTMVPGTTAYKDIHALEPGHMMIIDRKKGKFEHKTVKYWDINFPHKEDRSNAKSEEYYIEQVQEKLAEAVGFRLEADVPVGCYLSGGIDSCSMLGLSSSMQQSPVKAYTISFDHDDYDEASIAKQMAQRTGADQEMLNLKAADLYGDNYIKTVWHAERTFYNTLGVAKYCMSRRVNESGYRVVVTGEGADEQFAGYPQFKRDMLRFGDEFYSKEEQKSHQELMEKTNKIFKGAILSEEMVSHPSMEEMCGFTPSWIQPWMQTMEIAKELLSGDILSATKDYDPIDAIAQSFDKSMLEGRHFLDVAQYTWSKTMLECQILNWGGDRVDMAHSMESRPAFLDHHLAESAWEIPPHMRIKGNVEKYVLREAMKNILPEVLYKREKFAFMAPPGHTEENKRKAIKSLIDRFANKDSVKDAGVFDPDKIDTFFKEYWADNDPVSLVRKDALLNHILGLQILHHQFIKQEEVVEG